MSTNNLATTEMIQNIVNGTTVVGQAQGAQYLSKALYVKSSILEGVGWYKIATISTTSTAFNAYSMLLVVNTIFQTQQQGSSTVAGSGQLEIDIRVENGAIRADISGISCNYGNININNFAIVFNNKTAELYWQATFSTAQVKVIVLDEKAEIENFSSVLAVSYYGATPPENAVYAVVCNEASNSAMFDGKPASDYATTADLQSGAITVKEAQNAATATDSEKLGGNFASFYARENSTETTHKITLSITDVGGIANAYISLSLKNNTPTAMSYNAVLAEIPEGQNNAVPGLPAFGYYQPSTDFIPRMVFGVSNGSTSTNNVLKIHYLDPSGSTTIAVANYITSTANPSPDPCTDQPLTAVVPYNT